MNAFRRSHAASVLAVALLAIPMARPQVQTPVTGDPRVQAVLNKLKYKATVNANRAYEMTFQVNQAGMAQGRTQTVYVNSTTESFNNLEFRDVTSTAYKVQGKLPQDAALALLADNDKRKWGAWRTVEMNNETYVIYAVQIPANADETTMDNAIQAAMYTADEMEARMSPVNSF